MQSYIHPFHKRYQSTVQPAMGNNNTLDRDQRSQLKGLVADARTCCANARYEMNNALTLNGVGGVVSRSKMLNGTTPEIYLEYAKSVLKICEAVDQLPSSHFKAGDECESGEHAYVYPDGPEVIYLCEEFWKSSSEEKKVTIFHELSHFPSVLSTKDKFYAGPNHLRHQLRSGKVNADTVSYMLAQFCG